MNSKFIISKIIQYSIQFNIGTAVLKWETEGMIERYQSLQTHGSSIQDYIGQAGYALMHFGNFTLGIGITALVTYIAVKGSGIVVKNCLEDQLGSS